MKNTLSHAKIRDKNKIVKGFCRRDWNRGYSEVLMSKKREDKRSDFKLVLSSIGVGNKYGFVPAMLIVSFISVFLFFRRGESWMFTV